MRGLDTFIPRSGCGGSEEQDELAVKDYVLLADKIKKPRKVILTRLEYLILALLNQEANPLGYTGITHGVLQRKEASRSVNAMEQLATLENMGLIKRIEEDKTYKLTRKGRIVLKKAAALVLAMSS